MKIRLLKTGLKIVLIVAALSMAGTASVYPDEAPPLAKFRMIGPPKQIAPADGSVLTSFPRRLTLRWAKLNISRDTSYEVEIDCLHCTQVGKWDSEVGNSKILANLAQTQASHLFPGDNKGRWRVRAKTGNFRTAWSPWWHFSFKTVPVQDEKPNVCIDGLLRIGTKTTPWGPNYTVTLTPLDVVSTSGEQAMVRVEYYVKNCKGPATGTFTNKIYFNDGFVAQQSGLQLGPEGDVLQVKANVQIPIVSGVFKIKLDANDNVDEDWENDNEVWVNVQFAKK